MSEAKQIETFPTMADLIRRAIDKVGDDRLKVRQHVMTALERDRALMRHLLLDLVSNAISKRIRQRDTSDREAILPRVEYAPVEQGSNQPSHGYRADLKPALNSAFSPERRARGAARQAALNLWTYRTWGGKRLGEVTCNELDSSIREFRAQGATMLAQADFQAAVLERVPDKDRKRNASVMAAISHDQVIEAYQQVYGTTPTPTTEE